MHKLQRGSAPVCLSSYRHGRDRWSHTRPTGQEKTDIWEALDAMQGHRCAYCEAEIRQPDCHIEHFQPRFRFPHLTFDWSNLFGSCNRPDSCGKHKDDCGANRPDDLIKPDLDDPEHFFLFVNDGTIVVRPNLNATERHRAEETLRIFNLNAQRGALRYMRQQAVAGYLQLGEELRAIAADYPDEYLTLLHSELVATAHLPFSTAIKHTLLP